MSVDITDLNFRDRFSKKGGNKGCFGDLYHDAQLCINWKPVVSFAV